MVYFLGESKENHEIVRVTGLFRTGTYMEGE